MRDINEIIVHCSATFPEQVVTVSDLDRWHKQKGYKSIGYHYVVYLDGTVHTGRPVEQEGAHCKNHNAHSIGVCYIGGWDKEGQPCDSRTEKQKVVMRHLIACLKAQYPGAVVYGHSDFAAKACPCFNAKQEYQDL